jgi:Na+-driven multidrug efflux pump
MIYITRALLNGAGDTVYSFINGMIEMAGRIGLAGPLTRIGSIGVWGVWLATALTWLITGIASFIRYLQGKWKDKSVVRKNQNSKDADQAYSA